MKISINIDCTPEEARAFFGLPDLTSVNRVVTEALEQRVKDNIDTLSDPVKFWERAMSAGGQSLEMMQSAFQAAAATKDE